MRSAIFFGPANATSIGICWSSSIPTSNANGLESSRASAAGSWTSCSFATDQSRTSHLRRGSHESHRDRRLNIGVTVPTSSSIWRSRQVLSNGHRARKSLCHLSTSRRTRFAFALLAYCFAAIMLGTTLPTPMYALYADRMHFAVLDHDGHLRDVRRRGAARTAGVRPMVRRGRPPPGAARRTCVRARQCGGRSWWRIRCRDLLVGRVLSGLSAGIFTGTATAAVIEAAPPNWRNRAAAVATVANVGGLGGGPLLAGLLVQYAPHPLQPELHRAHRCWWCWPPSPSMRPETSPRTGSIGVAASFGAPQARAVFAIAAIAAFAGFAVTGLFTAVSPSFVSSVIGIDNHAVAGVDRLRRSSSRRRRAQLFAGRIAAQPGGRGRLRDPGRGNDHLAAALQFSSLPGLICGRGGRAVSARASVSAADWRRSPNRHRRIGAPRSARPTSSSPMWRSHCR